MGVENKSPHFSRSPIETSFAVSFKPIKAVDNFFPEDLNKHLKRQEILDYGINRLDDIHDLLVNATNISYILSFFHFDRNTIESYFDKIDKKFKIFNPVLCLAIKVASFFLWKNAANTIILKEEKNKEEVHKKLKKSEKELSQSLKKLFYFFIPFLFDCLKNYFSILANSILFCTTHLILKDFFELFESLKKVKHLESKILKTSKFVENKKTQDYNFFPAIESLLKEESLKFIFQKKIDILLDNKEFTAQKLVSLGIYENNELPDDIDSSISLIKDLKIIKNYIEETLKSIDHIPLNKVNHLEKLSKVYPNIIDPILSKIHQTLSSKDKSKSSKDKSKDNSSVINQLSLSEDELKNGPLIQVFHLCEIQTEVNEQLDKLIFPIFQKKMEQMKKKAEDTFSQLLDKKLQALQEKKRNYLIKVSFHVGFIALSIFSNFVIFPLCPATSFLFIAAKKAQQIFSFNLINHFTFILLFDSSSKYKVYRITILFSQTLEKIKKLVKEQKILIYTNKNLILFYKTYLCTPLSKVSNFILEGRETGKINIFVEYLKNKTNVEVSTNLKLEKIQNDIVSTQLELIEIKKGLKIDSIIQNLKELGNERMFPTMNRQILEDFELNLSPETLVNEESIKQKMIEIFS